MIKSEKKKENLSDEVKTQKAEVKQCTYSTEIRHN